MICELDLDLVEIGQRVVQDRLLPGLTLPLTLTWLTWLTLLWRRLLLSLRPLLLLLLPRREGHQHARLQWDILPARSRRRRDDWSTEDIGGTSRGT